MAKKSIHKSDNFRDSNFELLRIIAMAFIVVGHITLHGMKHELPHYQYIECITYTGVNLFVMISGYFGIRLKIHSFCKVFFTALFYSLLGLVAAILLHIKVSNSEIVYSFLLLSNGGQYWFISCYLMLMLISPAVNFAIKNSTMRQFIYIVAIFAYISMVSGWLFDNQINFSGFTLFHFVFIYLLGAFLNRVQIYSRYSIQTFAAIYTLSTLAFLALSFLSPSKAFRYNDPFVVLAAVSLFCMISKLKFRSSIINKVATYMLPIYLVQESIIGTITYNHLYINYVRGGVFFFTLILYIFSLILSTFIIETIRRMFMPKIEQLISNKLILLKQSIDRIMINWLKC